MTTGRGFARTRWSGSSSASTPTGRIRASARTRVWACRSPSRSSRPMADASGRRTAPVRPTPMARQRSSAPASWSGCRRHDERRGASVHASAVRVGNRAVLIRGPSGAGKSRLAFDLILAGRAGQIAPADADRRRPRPSRRQRGTADGPAGARTGRPDRNSRARHSPLRLRRRGRRRPGRRSGRRRCGAPAAAGSTADPDFRYQYTANSRRDRASTRFRWLLAALTMTASSSSSQPFGRLFEGNW